MPSRLKIAMLSAGLILATQAAAQVTFYDGEEFRGASFRVDSTIQNFAPLGFNDRAVSAVVEQGRWEVCEDAAFRGRCTILSPGNYPSLAPMAFNNRISSVRPVEQQAQYPVAAPPPPPPAAGVRLSAASGRALVRGSGARRSRGGRSARAAVLGRAPAGRRARAACAERARRDRRRDHRRRPRAPGGRRAWAGRRDGGRRRGGSRDRRQRRKEPGRRVHPGRPALRRGSRFGAPGLLGCHVLLRRPGAPPAAERAAATDALGQRQWGTADVSRDPFRWGQSSFRGQALVSRRGPIEASAREPGHRESSRLELRQQRRVLGGRELDQRRPHGAPC